MGGPHRRQAGAVRLRARDVFGVALDPVAILDELAEELPDGRAYIRDQLRRAANSVALNIAEGAGEFAPAEKARFYRMARRSATECAGQVIVCRRLGLTDAPRVDGALDGVSAVLDERDGQSQG